MVALSLALKKDPNCKLDIHLHQLNNSEKEQKNQKKCTLDLLAPFIEEVEKLARREVGSFCFHPLHPPRLNFTYRRKLLIQLPDLQR